MKTSQSDLKLYYSFVSQKSEYLAQFLFEPGPFCALGGQKSTRMNQYIITRSHSRGLMSIMKKKVGLLQNVCIVTV